MQFQLSDYIFKFLVQIFELTVPQFGDFGFATLLVCDLEHVYYFAVQLSFVVYYLWLQVIHHFALFIYL